jgi:signal transduction histidine kinase
LDLEEKVDQLIELGRDYLDMPYGFLTRIKEGRQHIRQAAGMHRLLQPGASCPLSESYCRKTIQKETLLAVQNAPDEGWMEDAAYEKFDLGSYVGSQVIVDGDLYGTFCFAATEPRDRPFSERERTFVELLTLWANYELEQRQAEERLRRQNERLDNFASVVTHDLRNPLNVAKGRLGLAREEQDSDHLGAVDRSLDRMDEIIEDVLTLTWGQQTIDEDDLGPCSLGEVGQACWDQVASEKATLQVEDPPRIRAEDRRIRRLLENLFRNAVEHGGEDISVRVGRLENGFFVEDTGPGIPAEKRDQVLEAGFTSSEEGTGLGLSIVTTVAETHGWDVDVTESAEGGARFEFTSVIDVEG